jgi:hypothetical protein
LAARVGNKGWLPLTCKVYASVSGTEANSHRQAGAMNNVRLSTKLPSALQDVLDMTLISLVRCHISRLLTTFSAEQRRYTKLYLILCSRRAIHYLHVTTACISSYLTSHHSD